MKVLIYKSGPLAITETFIRASIDKSPFQTFYVAGTHIFELEGQLASLNDKILKQVFRICCKLGSKWVEKFKNYHFKRVVGQLKPDIILAQFGTSGVNIFEVCHERNIPLVVYFRGYDASVKEVIDSHKEAYMKMFGICAATISVARSIRNQIIALGANPDTAFVNPSGADISFLAMDNTFRKEKQILSVGRFVDKKAPHLLLLSFAEVLKEHPDAKLLMIGAGPLLSSCKDLAEALGISEAVTFTGAQQHDFILKAMAQASLFVQHSLIAQNGDSEGTPVAVMEASAAGLPVIATKHAGIVDVVIHGKTGYLVDEKDVKGMAEHITDLLYNPTLMLQMGNHGRERIRTHFSHEICLPRLNDILTWVVKKHKGNLSHEKPGLIPKWN